MQIRRATQADARAICQVVIASITDLCVADHQNEPRLLEPWLANKTPEAVGRWLVNTANNLFVAVDDQSVVAAGCITFGGVILLNYVSPTHRFQGVSSAMLGRLEATAEQLGRNACSLESTWTARAFYARHGYVDDGPSVTHFGLTSFQMRKRL